MFDDVEESARQSPIALVQLNGRTNRDVSRSLSHPHCSAWLLVMSMWVM